MCKLTLIGLCIAQSVMATTYYVSTSGSDSNAGTSAKPFLTPAKGIGSAVAGDSVIILGGTYAVSSRINIATSGTAAKPIHLLAENAYSKRAVLNFASEGIADANQGVQLKGNYWHIKGLDIEYAGDNGMLVDGGSYDTLEWCTFHHNSDAGLQLRHGATHDYIIDCDSYDNFDSLTLGGNADGFSPKLDVGDSVVFEGCRSYDNSDDGWDGYLKTAGTSYSDNMTTILVNCWTFNNGYYHGDHSSSISKADDGDMNGNGFKMGGSPAKDQRHNFVLRRCLSFDNKKKQFDQNNNTGSMTLINCSAYGDGTSDNYAIAQNILASGSSITVENSVNLGGGAASILSGATQATNSWSSGFSISASDFQSVDTTGVRGARQSDGSLPNITFMHLKSTSSMINAGTIVSGITYSGSKPDLGAFEYSSSTTSIDPAAAVSGGLAVRQLGEALRIDGSFAANVRVVLFGQDGRQIRDLGAASLSSAGSDITLGALPHGVSFCRLAFSDGTVKDLSLLRP